MVDQWDVARSIADVDRDEWNAVVRACGGSVFHTYEWLMSYEQAPPAPMFHVRHLLLHRNGQLRAVAPLYEVAEDPHYTGYGPDYGFNHPILRVRMLVGHSWYSYFNGICSLDAAPDIVDGLISTMSDIAGELNTPLYGFPGVPERDGLCAELSARGFVPVYTEATSGVDFVGTAAGHLESLPHSKKRREFRRLATRAEKLGSRVQHREGDGDVDAFAKLVEDVCKRHDVPSINPPDSLRSIFRNLREYVHFIGVWKDETLLGGFVLLHYEDTLYAWIAGLNYTFHKEHATYYCLYAQTLELAEKLGVRRIEMGRSMYGFKTRMGFHPRPLVTWFRAGTDEGREVLRTGVRALHEACRTRSRIAEAYRANGLDMPAAVTGPPMYGPDTP